MAKTHEESVDGFKARRRPAFLPNMVFLVTAGALWL